MVGFDFSKRLFQKQKEICTCENDFKCFIPDFSQEKELYRVDDEPINIVNNAENVPFCKM